MDLSFVLSWLKYRIASFLGLRAPAFVAATPGAPGPQSCAGPAGASAAEPARPPDPVTRHGSATGSREPRSESTSVGDGDRPLEDFSHVDLGRRYAKTIQDLVEDAHERRCPALIADVLAWSLAQIAVCATSPAAIPETHRMLAAHMSEMLERRKATEAATREAKEAQVLH